MGFHNQSSSSTRPIVSRENSVVMGVNKG